MTVLFKVKCDSKTDNAAFQIAAQKTFGITWGQHDDVRNVEQQHLIIIRNPSGQLILAWSPEDTYHSIPAQEINAAEFARDPAGTVMTILSLLVQEKQIERINVLGHNTHGIMLINAMARETKREDLLAMYQPDHGEVNVELKINGHHVPLIPTLEDAWNQLKAKQQAVAFHMAQEAIVGAGLDGITDLMVQFKSEIKERLQAQFPEVDLNN